MISLQPLYTQTWQSIAVWCVATLGLLVLATFLYRHFTSPHKVASTEDLYADCVKRHGQGEKQDWTPILCLARQYHYGYGGAQRDTQRAEQLYHIVIANGCPDAYVYLGDLYYDHNDGATKALYYYNEAIKHGFYDCLLHIGDIYMYGSEGVPENQTLAKKAYQSIQKLATSDAIKLTARDRLAELKDNTPFPRPPPVEMGEVVNLVDKGFGTLFDPLFTAPQRDPDRHPRELRIPGLAVDIAALIEHITVEELHAAARIPRFRHLDDALLEAVMADIDRHAGAPPHIHPARFGRVAPIDAPQERNDRQTVHDHGVSKSVRKALEKLKESTPLRISLNTALIQVRNKIKECADVKKKERALFTLDTMERTNQHIMSIGMSELDVLTLIWNRIHHIANKDKVADLCDNLVIELSECSYYDDNGKLNPYCTTGRYTRIVDTLQLCDSENMVNIRPMYVLRQEIMGKAAKLRETLLAEQPKDTQDAAVALDPTPEQQHLYTVYLDAFKSKLRQMCTTEYVDTKLMEASVLDAELKEWIDSL